MTPQESHWVFTHREIWHLMQTQAPALLVGIADPYFGWESGKAGLERLRTAASLRQKGVDIPSLADPSPLKTILATCAHPDLSLIITSQFAGAAQTRRTIHFRGGRIVQHRELGPETAELSLLAGKNELLDGLTHTMRMDSRCPSADKAFDLMEADFFAAHRACRAGNRPEAEQLLAAGGVPADTAEVILGALTGIISNAAAVSLRLGTEAPVATGWSVLEAGGNLWILRPCREEGRKRTGWIPARPETIRIALERMMP
jgi:hypothetical protein